MDKVKINNQVVVMRKFVKQGKIRIINKFVKEIQRLRNRKGKEQQITKCQRKADRLLEEVAILKRIKPDTVSRMALSKSKDWKTVLSQKGVPREERCLALLITYGPVQGEVTKFYSENSHLTPEIPSLIQEWEEKVSSMTPAKNQNSKKAKRKSTDIKSNPCSDKLKKGNLGKKNMKPLKGKNGDDSMKNRDSENMDSDSEEEDSVDKGNGYFKVGNNSQVESDGDEADSESDNDEERDDGEDSEDQEDSDDNEENSEDHDSDDSDMHSDDEGNTSNNDLKNKTWGVKESKIKSKPVKKYSKTELLPPVKSDGNKIRNKVRNKIPSLKKNVPLEASARSTKAVALVNLNELMDMDELPIVSSKAEKQDNSLEKKKDSFFIKNGDEFSESEDSNKEEAYTHRNNFVKKPSFPKGRKQMRETLHDFKNKGNASHGKINEKGDQKFGDNFHFKQKFNKFNSRPRSDQQNFRKNKWNKGNESDSSCRRKFEKGDQKFRDDSHFNEKFNKFDRKESKVYPDKQNFKKNKWNKDNESNRKESKVYPDKQNFKKNKWNKDDESNRKESKPFNRFQERKQGFNKMKLDDPPRNDFSKTVKKDEPPLHPSWEAKRKLKQASNIKFQGKRMVFD